MTLAALIFAAIGAVATTVAALAALRTARTARDEAILRTQPYLVAGQPTLSESGDEVVVTVKNLGLGPARLLSILAQTDTEPLGLSQTPGLAPMETEEVVIALVLWELADPPTTRITVAGRCQDASGHDHPLYDRGQRQPLDRATAEGYEAEGQRIEVALRHWLKAVIRASRTGIPSLSQVAWIRFWNAVEAAGVPAGAVEWQVKGDWADLGGSPEQFTPRSVLLLTPADQRRYEDEQGEPPNGVR